MTALIIIILTGLAGGFQGAILEDAAHDVASTNAMTAENFSASEGNAITEVSASVTADEEVEDDTFNAERLLSDAIQVAPKIVSDIMYVSLAYSFGDEVSLELFDVLGIRVRSKIMTGPRVSIDVSTLPRGVYFLYATLGQEQRVVKRVIIH